MITIESVFDDPRVVGTFCDCDGCACYTDDTPLYFPNDLRMTVEELLEKEYRQQGIKDTEIKLNDN